MPNRAGPGYKRKFPFEQDQNKSENEVRNLLGHPPSKTYVIVTETDEPKKICVICNAWMNYHQKLFFWPPYVNQRTLTEYLLKTEKPSKNWTSYQLHTIYGEHDDYYEADKMIDYITSENFISDDQGTGRSSTSTPISQIRAASSSPSKMTTQTSIPITDVALFSTPHRRPSNLNPDNEVVQLLRKIADLNEKQLAALSELKDELLKKNDVNTTRILRFMKRKFDGMRTSSNVVPCSADASNHPPPSEFGIPVFDLATFDSLNNSLNDEEFAIKFKTYLEAAVPENQTPSTRLKIFLKMTLNKRIVEYYGLFGNSRGKLALKGTKLFESLEELFPKDFVKRVVNGKTVSEFNIVVQSWIKNIVDQNNKLKKKATNTQQVSTSPTRITSQNVEDVQYTERDYEAAQNITRESNPDGTYNMYVDLSPVSFNG